MVVYVEEGQLVFLLPQDEKESVAEFYQLGDVVPPDGVRYLWTVRHSVSHALNDG